jgi:hypothetical protein
MKGRWRHGRRNHGRRIPHSGDRVQSFTGVAPGDSVSLTHTLIMRDCDIFSDSRYVFGAVARNVSCPEPFGEEILVPVFCDERVCSGNLPPDWPS